MRRCGWRKASALLDMGAFPNYNLPLSRLYRSLQRPAVCRYVAMSPSLPGGFANNDGIGMTAAGTTASAKLISAKLCKMGNYLSSSNPPLVILPLVIRTE